MATIKQKILPCLWFDREAEDAARFYISMFPNSRIVSISHYTKAGHEVHGKETGAVLTVEFEIDGVTFTALNGGPQFKFTEAVSFQVMCDSQDEIDYFWSKLPQGGGEEGPCGWLKDRFGLSWQIVPAQLPKMLIDADAGKRERTLAALMKMRKFDIAALQRAYAAQG
jgi:predicted 3-demethylubiquinone-9 3-methyltransferase (glyoxalase superfamily)